MNTEYLPLEVRPCAFQPVDVTEIVSDVLAETVVNGVVVEAAFQTNVTRELIAHDVGAKFDVFNNFALNRFGRQVVNFHRAEIAASFHHPKDGSLARATSPGMAPPPLVLVAFFAADEGFVDFDLAAEGLLKDLVRAASRSRCVMNQAVF